MHQESQRQWRDRFGSFKGWESHDFCKSWPSGNLPVRTGNGCLVLLGFVVLTWVWLAFIA